MKGLRRSLRGCLIARRLGGDKREVEMHGYTTAISTICLWPDSVNLVKCHDDNSAINI
jgi:hypothetical protein